MDKLVNLINIER